MSKLNYFTGKSMRTDKATPSNYGVLQGYRAPPYIVLPKLCVTSLLPSASCPQTTNVSYQI